MREASKEKLVGVINQFQLERTTADHSRIEKTLEAIAEHLRDEDRVEFIDLLNERLNFVVQTLDTSNPTPTYRDAVTATAGAMLALLDGNEDNNGYCVTARGGAYTVDSSLDISGDLRESFFDTINS